MKLSKRAALLAGLLLPLFLGSCEKLQEKISITGVLIANTAVEDRIAMSNLFYQRYLDEKVVLIAQGDYSFVVGADSHLTTDPGRLNEMFQLALENDDLFVAHLGDIADTKAEYYMRLDSIVTAAKSNYVETYFETEDGYHYRPRNDTTVYPVLRFDDIPFPFFPVVGNHDITRGGWALWSNIFHSSFYEVDVIIFDEAGENLQALDHLIFLDSASGTLGATQIKLIEDGVLDGRMADGTSAYRNTFVFSHTNIFRPQFNEFASTFTREETFFLLDKFEKWNVTCVFCGHVHTWDERNYNGVHYLTLDTMCEKERPEAGDYLIRIDCQKDGLVTWSPVQMNYALKK